MFWLFSLAVPANALLTLSSTSMLAFTATVSHVSRMVPCATRVDGPSMSSSAWDANDEASLHEVIARASNAKLGEPEDVLEGTSAAWVLIFNSGQQDEGVYTLQGREHGSSRYVPSSFVLAFESIDDADRFAQLLQADDFDLATPSRWDADHLASFCRVSARPSIPELLNHDSIPACTKTHSCAAHCTH